MALLLLFLTLLGYDAWTILEAIWEGSLGSPSSIGVSVSHAVPEMLTATAVWLAFRAGLFNIGVDGQLQMGGLASLAAVVSLPASAPGILLIGCGLAAGTLAGAGWAGIAAVLKSWRGANEVISTIMLNFIAFYVINQMMTDALRDRSASFTTATERIPESAQLHTLLSEANITWAILVSVVVCGGVVHIVQSSNLGLRLTAIGRNKEAAVHAGLRVRRYWVGSFCLSGALCGLGGALVLLGSRYFLAPGWAAPWGFLGILIAFLALSNPMLIPFWALLFGMLASSQTALKTSAGVPDAIVVVMQTLPVVVLFSMQAITRLRHGRMFKRMRQVLEART